MNLITRRKTFADALEGMLFLALVAGAYALYRNAFGAALQFDDTPNLKGLLSITDLRSLLDFVFAGEAGPLGRPLSLLSFALQAPSWPADPADFQYVNVLLHLLNGALVALLAYRVTRLFPESIASPGMLAVVLAGLWVIHPLLVSTSLMIVQRMTLLSATAMLSALLLFVEGRTRLPERTGSAMVIMTMAIGGGTLLSALAKENGILLPLYAWVLDGTLLSAAGLPRPRTFRVWKRLMLVAPAVALVGYVIWSWSGIVGSYQSRPFNLSERIATEAVVLWE